MRRMESLMSQGLKHTAGTNTSEISRLELIGLTLAANGISTTESAARLGMREEDLENALTGAEQKLGARNRMQAVAAAIQQGLIGIEV